MRTFHGWKALVPALALTVALAGSLRADDAPKAAALDAKTIDGQVYKTLRDIINNGADVYNAGNYEGCYRLYEGALTGIKPFLGHRPELQKAIDQGLAAAAANPNVTRKAFDLRTVIDRVRADVNPTPKPPVAKTLWDRLGGEANVKKVVDDFVKAAATDPKVDFFRGGKYSLDAAGVAHFKKMLVEQISSVTGGPYKYTGKSMKEVHKGMMITSAQFDAAAADLKTALEKNGAKPDDVKTVMAVVGSTKKDIVEDKKPEPPPAKTLWDRLGGEANVKKVVDDFVKSAATDPKVDFFRGGKYKPDAAGVAHLKKMLVEQISSVTGGPYKYTGKSMKEVHKGMEITSEQFDAAAADLKTALEKNGAKPDDVKAVMSVVANTKKDTVEDKKPEPPPAKTLWERLGGEANVKKVVDDFVAAAATDKKVDFFRGGKYTLDAAGVAKLKTGLVHYISSVTGGPLKYEGASMKEAHKGMMITSEQFDAAAKDFEEALKKNGAKAEDIKTVMAVVGSTKKDMVEKK
jgi:hemoglobin